MTVGDINITADAELSVIANAHLSVELRPYANAAEVRIEFPQARLTWPADHEMLVAMADMCTTAAQALRGEVPFQQPQEHIHQEVTVRR